MTDVDKIDLWHFVHAVISDSRHRLDAADHACWGIFGIGSDAEVQRRYARAEVEARKVYETLRDYFEGED